MRNPYLRGMSLATVLLLLTTGTALAQLALSIQPACIECCPLNELGPCPGYTAWVTSTGWKSYESPSLVLSGPGPAGPYGTSGFLAADDRGTLELQLIFMCENPWLAQTEASVDFQQNFWWIHPKWKAADHGLWKLEMKGKRGAVKEDFLFAEKCEWATFVPEGGAAVLLSGGLVGLAGYAGLRWRTRRP